MKILGAMDKSRVSRHKNLINEIHNLSFPLTCSKVLQVYIFFTPLLVPVKEIVFVPHFHFTGASEVQAEKASPTIHATRKHTNQLRLRQCIKTKKMQTNNFNCSIKMPLILTKFYLES